MLKKLCDAIDSVIEKIISVLLAVSFCSVLLQVIYRFIISRFTDFSVPWTEELARYVMVWIVYLSVSIGINKGLHVSLDIIHMILPAKIIKWITIMGTVMMLGFTVIVTKEGLGMAIFNASQISPAMRLSMFWAYLAIPVGMLGASLRLLQQIIHLFKAPADQKLKDY